MGLFGAAVTLGYFDHPPLEHHRPWLDILWHPAVVTPLFALCYAAFLLAHRWHARNPPGPGLSAEPVRMDAWLPLGALLAALVLVGSLVGLTGCAAALAVACWIAVHVRIIGPVWGVYRVMAVLLVISATVPPAMGWPKPNLFAVLFLGAVSITMATGGAVDGWQYYRLARKARPVEEDGT